MNDHISEVADVNYVYYLSYYTVLDQKSFC